MDKVAFLYHPEVANGNLGKEYKEGTEHWVKNGALKQLMDILDGAQGKRPKFIAGSFGSVPPSGSTSTSRAASPTKSSLYR